MTTGGHQIMADLFLFSLSISNSKNSCGCITIFTEFFFPVFSFNSHFKCARLACVKNLNCPHEISILHYRRKRFSWFPGMEHPESDYIQRVLGEPLIDALSAVLLYKPRDPIYFLASYLRYWADKVRNYRRVSYEFHITLYKTTCRRL